MSKCTSYFPPLVSTIALGTRETETSRHYIYIYICIDGIILGETCQTQDKIVYIRPKIHNISTCVHVRSSSPEGAVPHRIPLLHPGSQRLSHPGGSLAPLQSQSASRPCALDRGGLWLQKKPPNPGPPLPPSASVTGPLRRCSPRTAGRP